MKINIKAKIFFCCSFLSLFSFEILKSSRREEAKNIWGPRRGEMNALQQHSSKSFVKKVSQRFYDRNFIRKTFSAFFRVWKSFLGSFRGKAESSAEMQSFAS